MTDYTKLRELAQAATDGPWVIEWAGDIEHDEDRGLPVAILHPIDVARQVYIVDDENGNALNVSNAEFIAAANPTVVLALLDELRDAKAQAWDEGFARGHKEADSYTGLDGIELTPQDCDVHNPYRDESR